MPVEHDTAPHELRSYGRRKGRGLSPKQQALLNELLPRIRVDLIRPLDMVSDPLRLTPQTHGQAMLSDPEGQTPLWLEIGFGGAEHLLWQAERNRGVRIIGCEPFEEGVVKALGGIDRLGLDNVRLHDDDARPLLRWLPASSLDRCFILFPDPWPKKRHVKRRLVSAQTLALLARVMKPGAELRIGTDIGDYARTILLAMATCPQFVWAAKSANDWRNRQDDWPPTRYEVKGLREGRRCYYLRFHRTAVP